MARPLSCEQTGYAVKLSTPVVSPATNRTLELYKASVFNGTGGSITAAIAKRLASVDTKQAFFVLTSSGMPLTQTATDITSAIIAGTAGRGIFTTAANSDGFIVQCKDKFNVVAMNVTQAQTGSPAYTYKYWNGSSFTTLTTIEVPASYAAGIQVIAFQLPTDWVTGSDPAIGGNSSGYYSILVQATTAPSQAVQVGNSGTAPSIWLARFLDSKELATKVGFEMSAFEGEPIMLDSSESLLPYFSGAANAANTMTVLYKNSG